MPAVRDLSVGRSRQLLLPHYKAGEKCFVDYSGATVPIINAQTGELHQAQIFVAVLGASNMEIMDDRHGSISTAMISQLPTDQWYAAIGDNTLADAIPDRLMHNAHRLPLKGESIRKMLNQLTEREHLE